MNSPVLISASFPAGRSSALSILSGVLRDCGAWIVHRELPRASQAVLAFEFPRDLCAEVYAALVSFGLDLNRRSHRTLTQLCCCTPDLFRPPSQGLPVFDLISLDLATRYVCSLEIIQAELKIHLERRMSSLPLTKTSILV